MAKLNVDAFSDDYKDIAPKECACFLVECLTEDQKIAEVQVIVYLTEE